MHHWTGIRFDCACGLRFAGLWSLIDHLDRTRKAA